MNHMFQTDLKKRKSYLKTIAKNNRSWPFRMLFYWFLMIIAVGIFAGVGYVLLTAETKLASSTVMIFVMMAVCLSCIPFFFGIAVKNTAKYQCAAPYSSMTNVKLLLTDEYLELVFWKASKEAPAAYSSKHACYQDEDKFIYRFDKNRIKSIKIDDLHVCHLNGTGTLTVPEWASSNDSIETKTVKSLSFITSFSDSNSESIILKWRDA